MQPYLSALPPARILAIEDDPVLAGHLSSHLIQRGFQVTVLHELSQVLTMVQSQAPDLILLDIMLPDGSGLDVLARLRQRQRTPVILMSALGAEQDRITGFSQGADDYLPKPFSMGEMDVRIDALLRRVAYEREAHASPADAARSAGLQVDSAGTDVSFQAQWAGLTSTEYRILEILLHAQGEVQSKTFLYQQALHRPYSHHDRSLDMHVSHIRRKLHAIGYSAGRVETVRGMGYLFRPVAP